VTIVYGDRDGIVVVPAEAVDEVFSGAIEKAAWGNLVLNAFKSGMSATDAYKKYGIM
jgi:regulator of RNase E activity RraA